MEQIDCPAPLPDDPASTLLTEMLVPAPYEAPEKKAKKKAAGTRKGLRRKVVPRRPPPMKTRKRKRKTLPIQLGG